MITVSDTYDPDRVVAIDVNGDPVTVAEFEAYSVHASTVLGAAVWSSGEHVTTVLWRRFSGDTPQCIVTDSGAARDEHHEVFHATAEDARVFHAERVAELRPKRGKAA